VPQAEQKKKLAALSSKCLALRARLPRIAHMTIDCLSKMLMLTVVLLSRRKLTLSAGASLQEVSGATVTTAAVVAALVATVSFSALTSPPGGWTPCMPDRCAVAAAASGAAALKAFVYLCMIALFSSLASLTLLLVLHNRQQKFHYEQTRRSFELELVTLLTPRAHVNSKKARHHIQGLTLIYLADVTLPLVRPYIMKP